MHLQNDCILDCAASTAIMSTNAVAFLLLNKFRTGATLGQLVAALDELRIELARANKDVGFSGDSVDVIYYAVSTSDILKIMDQSLTVRCIYISTGRITRSRFSEDRESK